VRSQTVCSAFSTDGVSATQLFKTGDRILSAQEHLYQIGDTSFDIYNLLDGWVALYRVLASGQRQILDFALPGAFLGYQANLDEPMQHGAVCITDVAVCVFPRKSFPAFVERHPAVGHRLTEITARSVARAHDQLTNVGARRGTARLAHMLLDMYMRVRRSHSDDGGDALEMPLTQELIADALGLTTVYVNRILRHLRERGLVIFRNGRLRILDLEALSRIAEVCPFDIVELSPAPVSTAGSSRIRPAPGRFSAATTQLRSK